MAVLNKRKIIGSTFLHLTTWLHNILSRSISYLQNDSGIGGFFSPLKYFISVSLSSTLFRLFCFNLGIGVFDGSYLCVGWAMIVAILCVSFNPFWKWICASKLSATIWIRPSLALTSLSLLSLHAAADTLNLRNSWYVGVIPYSCKCSINFLSLPRTENANYNFVKHFVSTEVTIFPIITAGKLFSKIGVISVSLNSSMRFSFSMTLYSFLEWGSLRASSFICFERTYIEESTSSLSVLETVFTKWDVFLLQHDNTCYYLERKDIYFFIHVILPFRNKPWLVSFTPSLIRIHFVNLQRWLWFVWKVSDWSGNILQIRDLWWLDPIITLCWHDLFGVLEQL